MVRAKEREMRVGGHATIQRQCVCCRLAGGRGEVFTRVWDAPTRRSVVVYSRKESGPVAQMTLTPSPGFPLPQRTIRQPAPRFTAIRFLPPLRAFVLSYCRRFCFLLRVNLLYLQPTTSPSLSLLALHNSCLRPTVSSFSLIRTSIFVQVHKYKRIQV